MNQKVNIVYEPLFNTKCRYVLMIGGRGAGRSTVASQYAIARLKAPEYFRCAIMRYILGDIRNSIYREIYDRAEENELLDELSVTENLMKIEYGQNSINAVGFRKSSGEQKSKLKSLASYNCVIIEEGDEVQEEDFMQLDDSLRTVKGDIKIIILLNPPAKNHWVVKRWLKLIDSEQKGFYDFEIKDGISDTVLIKTNYLDNRANIAPQSVIKYEEYRDTKPTHYWNMIKGLIPEVVVGKIFNNWNIIDELPHEARLERRGLDFGYTNDPSALIAIYYYNGGYILDEEMYLTGMSNKRIADTILSQKEPNMLVIADSAEPKSIDEIKLYGVNIIGAVKGRDSVNQGIQFIQDQKISITKRSIHLLEEYDNYAWKIDKDTGESLNVPEDMWNHGIDACFVGDTKILTNNGYKQVNRIKKGDKVFTSKGYKRVLHRWNNGKKQVNKYSLQFDTFSITIEATPEHLVKTDTGWTQISKLQLGQTIYLSKPLWEKSSDSILKKDIFQGEEGECTPKYGNTIMAQYQKAFMFITQTRILGTIIQATLNFLKSVSIFPIIPRKSLLITLSGSSYSMQKELKQLRFGTQAPMALNGIKGTELKLIQKENLLNVYVNNAGEFIKRNIRVSPNIVIQTAKLKHLDVEEGKKENVYDLTVKDCHEYFANNILVHNCRYGFDGLRKTEEVFDIPDDTKAFEGGFY